MSILTQVAIALSTRDTSTWECQQAISRAVAAGAKCIDPPVRGCPGIALARNRALTAALELGRPFVASIDDDISFEVQQLEQLVKRAEEIQLPVAAVYPSANSRVQIMPLGNGRFSCGLGCVVFPSALLLEHAKKVEYLEWVPGHKVYAFCQEGPVTNPRTGERHWAFDDAWLAYALGGYTIAPVSVRHIKPVPLHVPLEQLKGLFS